MALKSPLTQAELDEMGCSTPGCGHDHSQLYFTQRCHPEAGAKVLYDKRSGQLWIMCNSCRQEIVCIRVAE